MFLDRPLTWLFVVATVLVDIVLAVGGVEWGWESDDIVACYFLGQVATLGCWGAVGSRHRLERGAVFLIGMVALTAITCWSLNGGLEDWQDPFLMFFVYGSLNTLFAMLWKLCFRRLSMKESTAEFRYSLMELFGWTVVVAIASALLRQARVSELIGNLPVLALLVSVAAVPAVLSVLFAGEQQYRSYVPKITVLVAIAGFIVAYILFPDPNVVTVLAGSLMYTVAWIVAVRLDALSPVHTVPQTSTDDQMSPPRLYDPHASARQDLQ